MSIRNEILFYLIDFVMMKESFHSKHACICMLQASIFHLPLCKLLYKYETDKESDEDDTIFPI